MAKSKHVPQRTCIACRRQSSKADFLRVARTPAGEIIAPADPKTPGRGAYLCRSGACVERALKQGALERALKTPIDQTVAASLRALVSATGDANDD